MAESTLTVRTLCLATVALILACGHAARAMGQQQKAADKPTPRVVPNSNGKAIRVVPAGSGQTTVATITSKSSGGAGRAGGSKVATFTSKTSVNGSANVATFSGDQVVKVVSTIQPTARRPQAAGKRHPAAKTSRKNEPAVITVRNANDASPAAPGLPQRTVIIATPAQAQTAPAATPASPEAADRSTIRNAFGGLGTPSITPPEPRRVPPILSLQATAAR